MIPDLALDGRRSGEAGLQVRTEWACESQSLEIEA